MKTKRQFKSKLPPGLRARAEAAWRRSGQRTAAVSVTEVQRLVHDLEVHQVELEMQNEELRRAQAELAQSRDRFSDLYDFAPVGYVTWDASGAILEANLIAAEMLGVARRDLVRQKFTHFVAPDSQDTLHRHRQAVFAGGCPHTCELELRQAGGTAVPVRLHSIPAGDRRQPRQGRTAFLDLSDRRRAEEACARELQHRLLFELNPNPMFVFDERTLRLLAVNEAAVRLYGWPRQAFLRMTVKDIRPPGEVPKLMRVLPTQRGSRLAFAGEWRHRKKDGTKFDVEVTISHLPFQDCEARLVMVKDITERKRADEKLQQLNATLERRVAERTAKWRDLNGQLQQEVQQRRRLEARLLDISEREQRRFAQNLHDDVCSQLTGIQFLSHALAQDLAAVSKTGARRAREIAQLIRNAMDDARRLAQGLSPLMRDAHGLILGLQDLAARTRRIYHRQCSFRGQPRLQVADPAKALHLYRIAQEAVANAVTHSQARAIDISLTARGDAVILRVRDDGCGLAARPARPRGLGLLTMDSRAAALGASLVVRRNRKGGTDVVCTARGGLRPAPERTTP